jgi:predicted amidohydrolase
MKVSLFQCLPLGVEEMADLVSAALDEQKSRTSIWFVFPEHSLRWTLRENLQGLKGLERLLDLSKRVGLCFTCDEADGKDIFCSCLFLRNGQLVGKYRKRRATRVGAHAEGTEAFFFQADEQTLGSVLICFDVENAGVRDEVFCKRNLMVFNPTLIAVVGSVPAWKSAMDTMRNKFERMCLLQNVSLLRCDQSHPVGCGSSQLIAPCSSVSVASYSSQRLDVFVDVNDRFAEFVLPPKRERTKLEDNTGARHTSQFIGVKAKAAESVGNVLVVVSDVLGVYNSRDGSCMQSRPVHGAVDLAAMNKQSVAVVCKNEVLLLDVTKLECDAKVSSRAACSDPLRLGEHELGFLHESSIVFCDLRTSEERIVGSNFSCFFGDDDGVSLFAGSRDAVFEFDRRKLSGPLSVRRVSSPVVSVARRGFLQSDGVVLSWKEDEPAMLRGVRAICPDAEFYGMLDEEAMVCGPRGYRLRLHSDPVVRMRTSYDKHGMLSMSMQGALALTWFEFNCERCYSVQEMFK